MGGAPSKRQSVSPGPHVVALVRRCAIDHGNSACGRPLRADDKYDSRRRDDRGGSACEQGAVHFCAVMTSLFSTVPVSPWTLAPQAKSGQTDNRRKCNNQSHLHQQSPPLA